MGEMLKLPEVDFVPFVLTIERVEKLAMMNMALRELRDLGYRIIRCELEPEVACLPLIEIERFDAGSIGPLLDRSGARIWRNKEGVLRGYVEFRGVNVCWSDAI